MKEASPKTLCCQETTEALLNLCRYLLDDQQRLAAFSAVDDVGVPGPVEIWCLVGSSQPGFA